MGDTLWYSNFQQLQGGQSLMPDRKWLGILLKPFLHSTEIIISETLEEKFVVDIFISGKQIYEVLPFREPSLKWYMYYFYFEKRNSEEA